MTRYICLICSVIALFLNFSLLKRRKHPPQSVSKYKSEAEEQNRAIALVPRREMRADCWYKADFNSWGVFSSTNQYTVAVFDHQGAVLCEICPPFSFRSFSVDEERIHFTCDSGEKQSYFFREISFSRMNITFVPPAAGASVVTAVFCAGTKLRVTFKKQRKTFHYFSFLPEEFFEWLDPAATIFTGLGVFFAVLS